MGYSEPYSTLFSSIKTRLVNASGPFIQNDQVKNWIAEAIEVVAPSEEMRNEFGRSVPIALLCDGGNEPEGENCDGVDERQTIEVYFCSNAPTIDAALTGDGDEYWGACALKHWIMSRLVGRDWTVTGWNGPEWKGTRPVAVPGVGKAIMVATFEFKRQQTT